MRRATKTRSIAASIRAQLARDGRDAIDSKLVQETATETAKVLAAIPTSEELSGRHRAYVLTHNLLAAASQVLGAFREFERHNVRWDAAEDEYLPSYPPMSPVTKSFYQSWGLYDLAFSRRGRPRETYGSVALALAEVFRIHPLNVELGEKLASSRVGLYRILNVIEDDLIVVQEEVTGAERLVFTPDRGRAGDLLLVRLLPPVIAGDDVWVAFTTPYVIAPDGWDDFFARETADVMEYESLMKWGRTTFYWLEYIMQSYVDHTPTSISLTGVPDDRSTRPFFHEGGAAWLPERK